jgi:hypothetical protein
VRKGRWVKLYVREEGSFAQLPLYVRALGAELLKICDSTGRIALRGKAPWDAVAFQLGADLSDRRLLKKHIPLLIADGYLAVIGGDLLVRNFAAAQDRHEREPAPTETPPERETDASDARGERETDATETRAEHERDTRSESSPQNPPPNGPLEKKRREERRGEPDPSARRRQSRTAIWSRFLEARSRAAVAIGVSAPKLYENDLGYDEIVHRLRELEDGAKVSHEQAVRQCDHVIERAAFEARRDRKLEWFGGRIWQKRNFDELAGRPVETPRQSFQVIDLSVDANPFDSGAIEPMFTVDPE